MIKHWWEDEQLYKEYKDKHDALLKEYRDKFRVRVCDPAEAAYKNDAEGRARA